MPLKSEKTENKGKENDIKQTQRARKQIAAGHDQACLEIPQDNVNGQCLGLLGQGQIGGDCLLLT